MKNFLKTPYLEKYNNLSSHTSTQDSEPLIVPR